MMKKIVMLLAFGLMQCQSDNANPDRCALKPDPGNCYAYIIKYYYDPVDKRCKEFVWGGCGGVVPFHTLEECESGCGE